MTRFLASACTAMLALAAPASGSFHLWDIVEIYSNADGSVQFIELLSPVGSSNEHFLTSQVIRSNLSAANNRNLTFGSNLPSSVTSGKSFLIATPGFASLPGAVTPNYTFPSAPWFSPTGDTINFASSTDIFAFTGSQLPRDGINSLGDSTPLSNPTLVTALNSPRNFAGTTGSLTSPPVVPGDANGDRIVNRLDAAIVGANFGRTTGGSVALGDFNGDNMVTLLDMGFLQARFASPAASPAASGAAAVPEPSALLLGALGILVVASARRRRP